VALLRLASPVPNAIQNYVFGLTRIGFLPFAVTTFVFSIPQIVLYVYLGSAGRAVLLDESLSTLNRVVLGTGLFSILVAVLLIVRGFDPTQIGQGWRQIPRWLDLSLAQNQVPCETRKQYERPLKPV
jgi:hypothetical protein